jgi:hypothetical protein
MISIPLDSNSRLIQAPPAILPLKVTYDATISSSTAITLQATTTYMEVSAIDKGIMMAWGRAATTSDFDEYISPNTTRIYIVPTGQTSVQFIEASATAILAVIEK